MNLYDKWLNSEKVSEELKSKMEKMSVDEREDAFGKNLEFGTAGMRGLLGPGTNRLNIFTIQKATLGLALYLKEKYLNEKISVAISYDSRHQSKEFSLIAAQVLASYGIKSFIYDDVKPTPLLSFLVREKKAQAGIMITASHNPKEYNGYKVYNPEGAQINLVESAEVINKIESIKDIFMYDFDENYNEYITYIDENFHKVYLEKIKNISSEKEMKKEMKIIFTPEHGTSYKILPEALEEYGYRNLIMVEEQKLPDPDFTNTKSSNPEDLIAYELAIEYAIKHSAQLIVAHDPDADRLGIVYLDKNGEYIPLTGNQTGTLMIDYLVNNKQLKGNEIIYKTIVTGEMGADIAKKKNVKVEELLTGFKFIGEQIQKIEETKKYKFLFGYEESYGYLLNTCVRDKDAIQATILIAEMANYYDNIGKTLGDRLEELYDEFGYYIEETRSISYEGTNGLTKIKNIMSYFRELKIEEIANVKITNKVDYLYDDTGLPQADVLKFYLNNIGWFVFRPSGTEPKLKVYISVKENSLLDSKQLNENIYNELLKIMNRI